MDDLAETPAYREWYDRAIEPTLEISREVGNWYTGSVHVARASALRHALESGEDVTGDQLLVGSYGSGAQAEIHAETVVEGWTEEIAALDVRERLEARREISFEEYERVHDRHNHDKRVDLEPFTEPDHEFVFTGRGAMNEREYAFVE
jgi:hydroxymethylglutaryl-CoA synthase